MGCWVKEAFVERTTRYLSTVIEVEATKSTVIERSSIALKVSDPTGFGATQGGGNTSDSLLK
jgi:hypothetical protein